MTIPFAFPKPRRFFATGDDSWFKEIIEKIGEEDSRATVAPIRPQATGMRLVMANALNHALDITGRMGKEVLLRMLDDRYGLLPEHFMDKPGEFMGALRDLLGSSCSVLELEMLRFIRQETGINAPNVEEAAFLMKKAEAPR